MENANAFSIIGYCQFVGLEWDVHPMSVYSMLYIRTLKTEPKTSVCKSQHHLFSYLIGNILGNWQWFFMASWVKQPKVRWKERSLGPIWIVPFKLLISFMKHPQHVKQPEKGL